MAITIKNAEQIQKMRVAGALLDELDKALRPLIRPGVTTLELDAFAEDFLRSRGAVPSCKGYGGFPASICASVNEVVIHGIPNNRKLEEGDILSIDMGSFIDGFNGDCARTYPVGRITPEDEKLIRVTRESFFKALEVVRAGHHLHEIGAAVQEYVEANGFSVVRDFVGHGIGRKMHEGPTVFNYRVDDLGPEVRPGLCLAIEPMVTSGSDATFVEDDDWTVTTVDGSDGSHWEHSVAVHEGGIWVLTAADGGAADLAPYGVTPVPIA